jgi:NADH-quinone oxidoreductase subunit I
MYGQGIAKGLWITFKHFVNSYVDDIRYAGRKYLRQDNFQLRQSPQAQGAFTVQYPDEKIAVPERFRFVPFLVIYDKDDPEHAGEDWCTSCGICAKVCPPQCIWIVRGQDPNTGRPVPQPEAFFIDIDICMNCGYCAEFCPFDAIKMDHDYELASYDRTSHHIYDKEKLSKEMKYWKAIAPTRAYEEMLARGGWDHKDVIKEKQKAAKAAPAPKPTPAPAPSATGEPVATIEAAELVAEAAASANDDAEKAKAERLAKREAALARKRAREAEGKN